MSKKLIAVASATALALSALVGIAPAHASAAAAFGTGITGTGASSATAATVPLPTTNILSSSFSGLIDLTVATGDTVRIETTGAARVIETLTGLGSAANASVDVTKLGAATWTKTYTTTDTSESVVVYTTSTAVSDVKVTITRTGLTYTNTLYLKGATADAEYNITAVTGVPATLTKGATANITFKATDVFGNAVEDDTDVKAVTVVKVAGSSIAVAPTWDAAAKVYKATITSPSSSAFIVEVTTGVTDIVGFADSVASTFVVNNAAANAAATAQIAALTAQLADSRPKATSVTKKRYNTLARKWNRAFPSQAVKLKK